MRFYLGALHPNQNEWKIDVTFHAFISVPILMPATMRCKLRLGYQHIQLLDISSRGLAIVLKIDRPDKSISSRTKIMQ